MALPATDAELIWNRQHFASFSFYQDDAHSATSGVFVPKHLQLVQNCAFDATNATSSQILDESTDASPEFIAVVAWDEAVAAGCYSYAQVAQNLHQVGVNGKLGISGIIFGSSISNKNVPFGSPIVEPYGESKFIDISMHLTLTSAATAQLLLNDIARSNSSSNNILYLVQDTGPWNRLASAPGFKAQKYIFLCVSVALLLYTFWEIGLMLCTFTVWNQRMLMYLSAIGYLVVFAMLQPFNMNSRVSQMAVYVSWIIGYLSFTVFIVAWSSMVKKIHVGAIFLLHHQIVHYGAAALVSLTILLKLWAFAAESYPLSGIADAIVLYEMPAVFSIQTALLCFLIVSFLHRTFGIAISKHTKSVLRNVAVLCVTALLGCICIVALSITITTSARYFVQGYLTIVVLYSLGQCLLFVAIFGALWVRGHAKRTRPLFNQHEFYVDLDLQPVHAESALSDALRDNSSNNCANSIISIYSESVHQLEIMSQQRYHIYYPQTEGGQSLPTTQSQTSVGGASNTSSASAAVISTLPITVAMDTITAVVSPSLRTRSQALLHTEIRRKGSQRHVYVPLEPASARKMQSSTAIEPRL
ncbi:hypothetical protein GGI25_003341 [Coemansia spiralis]|uniref:Uncharacterized protein n=2 Tax=Coemansia TaxID=4863 RepID=A0A9W8KYD8_9FUNG|nr:hypothetical protein EDC05_006009 [Coemansia umbellata]KAJ2621658.1 hypothetical protein GGI26_003866 [Coemansia sp. RSA 1358]KAJ2676806.1 hypothetical protein GGI25_003341 [Coemansia spiralis]